MAKVTRGEFVRLMVLLVGTGGAIAACGDDDDNGATPDGGGGRDGSNPNPNPDSSTDPDANPGAKDASNDTNTKPDSNTPVDSGKDSTTPTASCTNNGAKPESIGSNHGHTLANIPAADFAGGNQTYTLTMGGHDHLLELSAAEMSTLKTTGTLEKESEPGGGGPHTHLVKLICL